jgi:hypothetical protein
MTNLTVFASNAADLRVMRHRELTGLDVGSASDWFGARLALIQVENSRGEDSERGAYDWWPLTINGDSVGELRDDANGITIHVEA